MKNLDFLRSHHPQFFYRNYSYQLKSKDLHIAFEFAVPPGIIFHPTLILKDVSRAQIKRIGEGSLQNLVFHLGLVEMISYWKATCSPEIVVETGHLNTKQQQWFHDLILKGMGEFFYKNKIDFTKKNFLTITSAASLLKPSLGAPKLGLSNKALVPIGGGKDAVVTLEILKKAKVPLRPFLLNERKSQMRILSLAKTEKPILAERTIDPKLLELNRKGYLNGHTPFSAYLAFLTTLTAALFNYKYIALSNERSANEGNVTYLRKTINHQYSKTYEFEKKFRSYSKTYLAKDIEYFSFLRPLYELQIAKLFSNYPKYFSAFLSCNVTQKTYSGKRKPTQEWCGKCAKCLFVFLVLYPFLGEKQTTKIFKKNLLKDKELKPLLQELIGKKAFKPFECVGTIAESKAALSLQKKKSHPILKSWNSRHFLPKKFTRILQLHLE